MTDARTRLSFPRALAIVGIVAAVFGAAAILLGGGSSYKLHVRFSNASGLVKGNSVSVAGHKIGTVTGIDLSPDGHASVTIAINDAKYKPLHRGTRAGIRVLGQAGLANRYVALSPGAVDAAALRSGDALPLSQTSSMVNLDAILNSFGASQRSNLQQLVTSAADVYAGSGARYFNTAVARLNPALVELNGLTGQLTSDRAAFAQLTRASAATARALASRKPELVNAVSSTATTLNAVASRDRQLSDVLIRAPGVLGIARHTLANARTAITALRPALADVPAAARPLRGTLTRLTKTLPATTPVVSSLRGLLPDLRSTLLGFRSLAPIAVKAIDSAGIALRDARPILRVFRFYGSDLLIGVFQGLFSIASSNYNRDGHYVRIEFTQPYQTLAGGPAAGLLTKPLAPSLFNLRTQLLRRCPGGNTPPAPDGSNPWVPDTSICTPSQSVPLSVNYP